MNLYKTSALTLCSLLTLAGCPSDDTGETGTSDTDPTTGTVPTTGTDTVDETDTIDPDTTDTDTIGETDTDTDTDTAADGALIRVVHGSPGAPAVDIWVMGDDAPVLEGLAYGDASEYLDVPAGDYVFEVRAAGDAADVDPVYSTDALTLAAGDSITAIAAGQLGGEDDAAFRVLALADGFDDPGDGAVARIVHAGSDAPAVDIDVGNDGTLDLEGVALYADSGAAGVALPAGEALQVGILDAGDPLTAFTTPELPAGGELYIIATGLTADMPRAESGFSLLAVGPDGAIGFIRQNPRVYALHAGTDAPTVDICVAGAPLLTGVEFGAMGGVQVAPGEYTLDIHATGDEDCAGDPAFSAATPALAAGEQYLAAAAGELATDDGGDGPNPDFTVEFFTEAFTYDPASTDASLRVIHAASAPAVTAGALDENGQIAESLFQTISFPNETGEFPLPGGEYVVGLAGSRGVVLPADPIAAFGVTAPAGVSAWVVAHGSLDSTDGDQDFGLSAIIVGPGPWTILPLAAAPE